MPLRKELLRGRMTDYLRVLGSDITNLKREVNALKTAFEAFKRASDAGVFDERLQSVIDDYEAKVPEFTKDIVKKMTVELHRQVNSMRADIASMRSKTTDIKAVVNERIDLFKEELANVLSKLTLDATELEDTIEIKLKFGDEVLGSTHIPKAKK